MYGISSSHVYYIWYIKITILDIYNTWYIYIYIVYIYIYYICFIWISHEISDSSGILCPGKSECGEMYHRLLMKVWDWRNLHKQQTEAYDCILYGHGLRPPCETSENRVLNLCAFAFVCICCIFSFWILVATVSSNPVIYIQYTKAKTKTRANNNTHLANWFLAYLASSLWILASWPRLEYFGSPSPTALPQWHQLSSLPPAAL